MPGLPARSYRRRMTSEPTEPQERDIAAHAVRRALVALTRLTPDIADVQVDASGITIVRNPAPIPTLSGLLVPDGPVDLARLRALTERFVERGAPWSLSVLGEPAAEVVRLAEELRLVRTDEPSMVLPLDDLPDPSGASGPEEYVRLSTESERLRWIETSDTAFGLPAGTSASLMRPQLLTAPGVLPILALRDGRAVAIGLTVLDEQGWLGVFSVATVPDARRTGIGERMVRFLLETGRAAGGRWAHLQSSEQARSLYARFGFRDDPVGTVYFATPDEAADDPAPDPAASRS